MTKNRLEAFSDGVIAIIITIMVLELKVPHSGNWESLKDIFPIFLSYILSFIYVGNYWNNHHHMIHAVEKINGLVLWANLHLLFWLSLLPFTTGWMGENHFSQAPVLLYGINLLMCALAYTGLVYSLVQVHGAQSSFQKKLGRDIKGKLSVGLYVLGITLTFFEHQASLFLFTVTALIWFIPDQRFEKV